MSDFVQPAPDPEFLVECPAPLRAIASCVDGAWAGRLEDDEREWTSSGFWRLLGFDPPITTGHRSDRERRILTEDRPRLTSAVRSLRNDPTTAVDEVIRHRHEDGSIRWLRCRLSVIQFGEPPGTWLLGTATDLTEVMDAERVVGRAERELRALADSVESMVLCLDDHDRIVSANRSVAEAVGVAPASLVGHSIAAVFGDRQPVRRVDRTSAPDHDWGHASADDSELRVLRAGEERNRRLFSTRLLHYPDASDGTRRTLFVADDITDLHRSRQTLRSLFEHLPAAVSAKDLEGRYLFANSYLARLLGIQARDILGRTDRELLPPALAEQVMQADEAVAVSGEPASEEITVTLGERRLTLVSTRFPLLDADGTIYATAGMSFDVSELHRLQADLSTKNAELERFIFTASHDLKSPLVTILGYSRYLAADLASGRPDELDDYADRIRGAAEQMQATIEDLLEFSRVGRRRLDPQLVDLEPLVADVLDDLRPALDAAHVTVSVRLDHDQAWCDPGDIRTVLENLLSNALRYGSPGDAPRLDLNVVASDAGQVRFELADHGPGINPDHAERVFELFERLSTDGPGTGVGLAIVRRIVELNHGRVCVVPTPGGGATFQFTLPTTQTAIDRSLEPLPCEPAHAP